MHIFGHTDVQSSHTYCSLPMIISVFPATLARVPPNFSWDPSSLGATRGSIVSIHWPTESIQTLKPDCFICKFSEHLVGLKVELSILWYLPTRRFKAAEIGNQLLPFFVENYEFPTSKFDFSTYLVAPPVPWWRERRLLIDRLELWTPPARPTQPQPLESNRNCETGSRPAFLQNILLWPPSWDHCVECF